LLLEQRRRKQKEQFIVFDRINNMTRYRRGRLGGFPRFGPLSVLLDNNMMMQFYWGHSFPSIILEINPSLTIDLVSIIISELQVILITISLYITRRRSWDRNNRYKIIRIVKFADSWTLLSSFAIQARRLWFFPNVADPPLRPPAMLTTAAIA